MKLSKLEEKDIPEIVLAFKLLGWSKPKSLYDSYLEEQNRKLRTVFIAKVNGKFAGYVTLKWKSDYFQNIPEIADLNVLPTFRRNGIGSALILACEELAANKNYNEIGIGVGLTADYGNAQRLYVQLKYIPDGKGLFYKNKSVDYLDKVTVDDELVLYFTKRIK